MKTAIPFLIILMASPGLATIASFAGEQEGEAPRETFEIGVGSDQNLELSFHSPEKEGLNVQTPGKEAFIPAEAPLRIEARGLPAERFTVNVSSEDPVKREYRIPVTVEASRIESSEVAFQRTHVFRFETDYTVESPDELIQAEEESEKASVPEGNSSSVSSDSEQGGVEASSEGDGGLNPVLVGTVLLLAFYLLYEVLAG